MPLTPFYGRFRDLAFSEMRTVALRGHETIPDGYYGFIEFYCDERCACGARIWVIGSAEAGNGCFTCITGDAWPRADYEIDEACVDRS